MSKLEKSEFHGHLKKHSKEDDGSITVSRDVKRLERQRKLVEELRQKHSDAASNVAPFPLPRASDLDEWLGANFTKKFEGYIPAVKRPRDPSAALAEVRERIALLQKDAERVDRAPIPSEAAISATVAAIENLAASGAPDFGPTLRNAVYSGSGRRMQGTPKWPQEYIGQEKFTGNGLALVAWLHKDALIERAKAEIMAQARDDEALTLAERPAKRADIEAQILAAEREEEVIFEMCKGERRREGVNMLAILELKPIR